MEIDETDELQSQEPGVAIYSKWAILGFSIFFSPLVGGILLMLNLRSIGYKKEGNIILLFAIIYFFLSRILLGYLTKMLNFPNQNLVVFVLVLDIIGGGILAEYFFKKYFPDNDYEYKSILKPLIVLLLITIPISMLYLNMGSK